MEKPIEVICQHKTDGTILPIKIRCDDEDGEYHVYRILSFRELAPGESSVTLPSTINATKVLRRFDCKIHVFGKEKCVSLLYNTCTGRWDLRA
ncbi:MAG: hypothetical protein K6F51_08240 [Acetatifactor sp.]|nr:hypothetical protein [Acetatifactor sp.]